MKIRKIVLLHTCCGPCSAACIERLLSEAYEPILLFTNSNIFPFEEFQKRAEQARVIARKTNTPLLIDRYDHSLWKGDIRGHENEPEKGSRCKLCFEHALARTARWRERMDVPYFTTTLTVSPHKISSMIFEIGKEHEGFLEINFKKQDGFKRTMELSHECNLYVQNYCGCEFSLTP